MKFSCHLKMYQYLFLSFILICSISANDINDYNQSVNNYDLSNNTTQNQNVIDLIQTIQLNSTQLNKNLTTNLTSSNIPILFNQYQYDQSPVYQDPRNKEQLNSGLSSSSSSQSTLLDSSGTNQNYLTKDYSNFDDNQNRYIEQQIEQDNKYLPELFDLPPSPPAQIIEPPSNENQISQVNLNDYGTKITKPIQNSIRTPVINKINKYPVKGTVNSIKMANNQEWNVIDKNTQTGYINIGNTNLGNSKFTSNTYQSNVNDDSFSSFDQQYDLTKINKIKSINQLNYNKPIDGSTQIITSNNQQSSFQPIQQQQIQQNSFQPIQQQIISSNYPSTNIKQQTVNHQYSSPNYQSYQQQQINYTPKKPPCSKNNLNRQRPFYFGWKQNSQQSQSQRQKVAINNAMNYIQQNQQQQNYQNNNYQANQNKYFGMPNQYDQFGSSKKCCIVRVVRRPGYIPNQPSFSASSMQFNPFNSFQSGMFGGLGGGFVNKLENKKSKIKNLIKAPFMFVNDMKHKALGGNNQMRNPNFHYPIQQQPYPTKTSYNQAYNY